MAGLEIIVIIAGYFSSVWFQPAASLAHHVDGAHSPGGRIHYYMISCKCKTWSVVVLEVQCTARGVIVVNVPFWIAVV
ncbi:hypothetical protein QBC47DRAFT_366726 [Echria macrotheca]|uniref:Secreted protein n=1 Tax=Echria macrotheca TaxID=438768 RepID=A0AAJ0BNT4_9PEZI|nr:hypothetical protein QBC47DRAFT_366726 [Echria macrotheca]